MKISVINLHGLNYRPQQPVLGKNLKLDWTLPVDFHQSRSRFLAMDDNLIFVDGSRGLLVVGVQPPQDRDLAPWRRHEFAAEDIYPSCSGRPVLLSKTGKIFRWSLDDKPQEVYAGHAMQAPVVATGVSDSQLLLQIYDSKTSLTQLVDTHTEEIKWKVAGSTPVPLIHDDCIVMESLAHPGQFLCIDIETGHTCWKTTLDQSSSIVGALSETLWIATKKGSLYAIHLASGALLDEIAIRENHSPQGIIDKQGHFHICNGLSYQIRDLNDDARLIEFARFKRTEKEPGLSLGRTSILSEDGRLIFCDDRCAVFVVNPDDISTPHPLWTGSAMIVSMGVANSQLFILDTDGVMRCFGEQY